MELFELILLLLVAVLASSVLDEALPLFSLPLLQIALGVGIAVALPSVSDATVDPELFLLLFIAPLLFNETQHVDKLVLWRNKWPIISLALGLVVASVLAVGFTLNFFQPSIALASAFALGAALGPTDAAAVVALGKDVRLSPRQKALLSGEALINDASGVVCFQFALAAAVTGTFSIADAGIEFVRLFFGGIAIGLGLGVLLRSAKSLLRVTGLDNTTVNVVLSVLAPFVLFMAAEHFHLSGILSVVAGGLLMNMGVSKTTVANARANIVSNNVWEVLVFIINGVLFVMLGMQLPGGVSPTWEDVRFSTSTLILLVLVITFVSTAVRFIWMLGLEMVVKPKQELKAAETGTIVLPSKKQSVKPSIDPFADPAVREQAMEHAETSTWQPVSAQGLTFGEKCKNALVTTLAGPRGAVTLSIIMTIPYLTSSGASFPYRNMLIFLASGVILCTLLMANFLLPVLAPNNESGEDRANVKLQQIKILRQVQIQLSEEKTPQNEKATQLVVRRYRERIRRLRASEASPEAIKQLRLEVLDMQQEAVHGAIVDGLVSRQAGQEFANRLKRVRKVVTKRRYVMSTGKLAAAKHGIGSRPKRTSQLVPYDVADMDMTQIEELRKLIDLTERKAIKLLEERAKDSDTEVANSAGLLLMEHKAALASSMTKLNEDITMGFDANTNPLTGLSSVMHAERNAENLRVKEVMAEGYRLELEKIQDAREMGRLSRKAARDLREEVYLLQMDASDAL